MADEDEARKLNEAPFGLLDFIEESNRIEGIHRRATDAEIRAHSDLISAARVSVDDLEQFVSLVQSSARLRSESGMNVRVGNHIPPSGGMNIVYELEEVLSRVPATSAYETHLAYETLHPFTDGNGRSGRALWLWQMVREDGGVPPLGFLHTFYYQALDASGRST